VVAAVVAISLTVHPTGSSAQARAAGQGSVVPSGVTATPVLSARRLPGWIEESVAAQRLSRWLAPTAPAARANRATGCLVVQQGGQNVYAWNPVARLIPASNEKLLTATAVIDRLGPSGRFVTSVAARPVAGVVHGNLYLVGSGDPYLRTPAYASAFGTSEPVYTSLASLALDVRRAGVTRITGSVLGDENRFDQLRIVPSWSPAYAAEGDAAPLSALDVNDTTAPASPSGSSAASAQPASTSSDPAVRAAATFSALLHADGVVVAGPPARGIRPATTPVLASMASQPFARELDQMLTVSDDTAAELFTKDLGYAASRTGSTAAGMAVVRADLARDGLPVAQFVGADGSGLSRADRVSCNLLAADLGRLGPTSVVGRGLPVAGRTGTLADRMVGTPAAGRVVAKTGTLNGVVALSGFVLPARRPVTVPGSVLGDPLVFAFVLNGVPTDAAGRQLADRVAVTLAHYPQIVPVAEVSPRR
jgi:D-alanyl-D-alanine carboxypeptidase/D-alanyl-D-alanine-endopeptidase (penicillin-binding protein 4)